MPSYNITQIQLCSGENLAHTATATVTVGVSNETYTAVYGSPYSEGLAFTSNGNGTCYVSGIGTCKDTDIVIPPTSPEGDTVTAIGKVGYSAFKNCTNITSVDIPNGVTRISNNVFYGCSSLASITIPNTVTSIGKNAFEYCVNLTTITFANPEGWWYSSSSTATSGTEIPSADLADPATAATYLTSTYKSYYWKRG